jgi:stage III sporulation protein AH
MSRRTIILAIMAALGLLLFYSGYHGMPGQMKAGQDPGQTVAGPEVMVTPEYLPEEIPAPESVAAEQPSDRENFFVEYRLERERTRGKQMEMLREIIANPATGQEAREVAQNKLLAMGEFMTGELELESMIRAKGFNEVAVFLKETGVTVIVRADQLSPGEAGRIMDLVVRETGLGQEKIIIIPKA